MTHAPWKTSLWQQFGAAIDMLENAIDACPEELWADPARDPRDLKFGYVAFHALYWLDYYLAGAPAAFTPPAPFGREELDPAGVMPPRVYTRDELRRHLAHTRAECRAAIAALTEDTALAPDGFGRLGNAGERMVYNLRHLQHHVGQLQLMLRQAGATVPGWVSKAGQPLA